MEKWTLDHPELGLIEVERGYGAEFGDFWPEEAKPFTDVPLDANYLKRWKLRLKNPSPRLRISVDGQEVRQLDSVRTGKVNLTKYIKKELTSYGQVDKSKPYLKIQANGFGELLMVTFRRGEEIMEFLPPEGTRGKKRYDLMASSGTKRLLFPLIEGMGRAGWAVAVLLLHPILTQIWAWIKHFFPDLHLPDWDLPDLPPLRHVSVPVPHFPTVTVPVPTMPNWDLPQPPEWVIVAMDYQKVWVPIVIGLVLGISAVITHHRAEKQRQEREQQRLAHSQRETVAPGHPAPGMPAEPEEEPNT